ncbi:MAG: hypothetical protein WA614_12470 [Acidimicrobiales bacterium]
MPRHHEVSAYQSAARCGKATEHSDTDGKRRIRNYTKWSTRQPKVLPVGAYDRHVVVGKSLSQLLCSSRMQLECDDSRSLVHQSTRQYAGPGPDIQDELASSDIGVAHEPFGPSAIEPVPSPSCPWPGHG